MFHFLADQIPGLSLSPSSKPFLGFASFIGNDVCKSTLEGMTTPQEYESNLLRALESLDRISPPNSKLMVTGLVDGTILWGEMANRRHPLGVPYKNVYNFLDCTDANTCKTWLSSNDTRRQLTTIRAMELSKVAEKFIRERGRTYKNIEVAYMDFPLKEAVEDVRRRGLSPSVLIEEVDGFHPSHTGHKFFGEHLWKHLTTNYPHWIGPINPNNELIKLRFGNQGGH